MGFMRSYKYLDNLCKDMNGIGVTGYIEDMKQEKNGKYYVAEWNTDYLKLKHYRYIRNQIAHENYANEENMCSDNDITWIDEFYQRIMNQTDPLALYYKKTKFNSNSKPTKSKMLPTVQYVPLHSEAHRQPEKKLISCAMLLLIIGIAILILIYFF
ncbi:MAG: hypothetical protein NC412_00140 [Roseburia sp.]|nr:hypothetical protein [Roseburia sp.]MCM1277790.1 hypothetical protein [Robinsoniella sp.]